MLDGVGADTASAAYATAGVTASPASAVAQTTGGRVGHATQYPVALLAATTTTT